MEQRRARPAGSWREKQQLVLEGLLDVILRHGEPLRDVKQGSDWIRLAFGEGQAVWSPPGEKWGRRLVEWSRLSGHG